MKCPKCGSNNTHRDPTGRAAFYCSVAGCGWAGDEPLPAVGDGVNYYELEWGMTGGTVVLRAAIVTAQRERALDLHVFRPPRYVWTTGLKDSGVDYVENAVEGVLGGCWSRRKGT